MKITKKYLQNLIKEEVSKSEQDERDTLEEARSATAIRIEFAGAWRRVKDPNVKIALKALLDLIKASAEPETDLGPGTGDAEPYTGDPRVDPDLYR
jgi:hypothetical protein